MKRTAPLLLVLVIVGCGAEPAPAPAGPRLVAAGAETRTELRLAGIPGLRQALRFSLSGRSRAEPKGAEATVQEIRGLLVDLTATVLDRSEDGKMLVDIAFERSGGTPADSGQGGGPGTGWLPTDLDGTTSRLLVSPRGGVLEGKMPSTQIPFVLFVPLPEEPVGVGARWEIRSRPVSRGLEFDETTTFTLASLDGVRAEVDIEILQTLDGPAIVAGGALEILSWKGRGTGRVQLRLDAALIDAARLSWTMTSAHVLRRGEETAEVTTTIECEVQLTQR